jgi:S-DNA-T family DNA segregation ATPase FtsK/SpoIIIE
MLNFTVDYKSGKQIETELNSYGIKCSHEETIESAVVITHYYYLDRPQDILKLGKALKILEVVLGKAVIRTEKAKANCFGLEIEKDEITVLNLDTRLKNVKRCELLVGEATDGKVCKVNLNETPHLLIAGCTGSGKSVLLTNFVKCILNENKKGGFYKPFIIDTKRVGFTKFADKEGICEVATTSSQALSILKWATSQMYERYEKMQKSKKSFYDGYKIIIIIDEFADLIMSSREIESFVVKLAQMGRACGIHLIIATQRPTVNIVTGLIKANIPDRIALRVSSARDSAVILEQKGAEKLKGKGDCLVKLGNETKRVQCYYSK